MRSLYSSLSRQAALMYTFILQGLTAFLQWTVKLRQSADKMFSYLKLHFPARIHVCILSVASPGCMTPVIQTKEMELCKQSCWLPYICLQMKRKSWCCTCLGLFKPPKYNTSVAQTRLFPPADSSERILWWIMHESFYEHVLFLAAADVHFSPLPKSNP